MHICTFSREERAVLNGAPQEIEEKDMNGEKV